MPHHVSLKCVLKDHGQLLRLHVMHYKWINVYGVLLEWNNGTNQITWKKAVQVPVHPPQIPYGLIWDQTQVSKWSPDRWRSQVLCRLKHHNDSTHRRCFLDLQNCYELSAHSAALPANHDTWRCDWAPWLAHTLSCFSTTSSSHTSHNRNQHGSLGRPTTQVHTTPIIHHCNWSKVSRQHTRTKYTPSLPQSVSQHGIADEYDVGTGARLSRLGLG